MPSITSRLQSGAILSTADPHDEGADGARTDAPGKHDCRRGPCTTSEKTLNTLTCCFSGGGGVPELGLGIGEHCHTDGLEEARVLFTNAVKYEKMAAYSR